MCEVRSRVKTIKKKPKINKMQWSTTKEMDYDEPHLMPNEKTH
jgi:hypothetical protein